MVFFLQMWLEKRGFLVWFHLTGQNCSVRLGKSTPVMFAEQFDVEKSFFMGLFERFGKDDCEERRVNSGLDSNHCKYWCMIIYTSSIEFDTHGKLLRPAMTNLWDLKNKIIFHSRAGGVVFLGGEDCSLPCLPWKLQVALVPSGGIENLPPLLGYWWTSGQSSGIFWR